jgi:hypothetical protein
MSVDGWSGSGPARSEPRRTGAPSNFGISELLLDRQVETVVFRFSPASSEGRFAIVTDAGCGMRWTLCAGDEQCGSGRRSRVVLTPRRWRQVGGAIHRRWWQQSPVTKESAKETVKTIARGMPGDFRRDRGD